MHVGIWMRITDFQLYDCIDTLFFSANLTQPNPAAVAVVFYICAKIVMMMMMILLGFVSC